MRKLNKVQTKYLTNFYGLSKKDMPIGIDKKQLLEHLKGNNDNFNYNDFYSSVISNYNNFENRRKIDKIGSQLSFVLAEALEDEHYELCKNLAKYFERINNKINFINSVILYKKINDK